MDADLRVVADDGIEQALRAISDDATHFRETVHFLNQVGMFNHEERGIILVEHRGMWSVRRYHDNKYLADHVTFGEALRVFLDEILKREAAR